MRCLVGAVAVVFLTAACSTTVGGVAARESGFDPDAPNPALMRPGNYPTTPRPPLGVAGDYGSFAEGRRMAENVTLPYEADSALSNQEPTSIGVVDDLADLGGLFPSPVNQGAADLDLVTGFSTFGSTPSDGGPQRGVNNVVLRFASADDASAAVAGMTARSAVLNPFRLGDPSTPTEPVRIPGQPSTMAVTYTENPSGHVVLAYTAHGPYVLAQRAWSVDDVSALAPMVDAVLVRQKPLIDQFRPTPVDQLARLPLDPDGLLARTLPKALEQPGFVGGFYGPRGALALTSDPDLDTELFAATGVTAVARSLDNVYVTRDAAAARDFVESYAARLKEDPNLKQANGVAGLPAARCYSTALSALPSAMNIHYCLATADRYVIEVQERNRLEMVQQIVSAQYLMLTA